MAIPLVVDDVVRTSVYCSFGGQVGVNVRHWRVLSKVDNGITDLRFAQQLDDTTHQIYKNMLPTAAKYEGVTAQVIQPVIRPPVLTNLNQGAGLIAGDALPPQTSGLLSLTTDFAGRRFRGRMYVPFPGEASSGADGKPINAYLIRLISLGQLFTQVLTFSGEGNDAVTARVVMRGIGPNFYAVPVTAFKARIAWATQRRRSFVTKGDQNPFA